LSGGSIVREGTLPGGRRPVANVRLHTKLGRLPRAIKVDNRPNDYTLYWSREKAGHRSPAYDLRNCMYMYNAQHKTDKLGLKHRKC